VRHLAVGDIHGCYTALTTLAAYVPFQPDDVLITLGDYVDRGPNSRAVLDWLIDYQQKHELIPLRGNHEVMMLQARWGGDNLKLWLESGGDRALRSYAIPGKKTSFTDVPPAHWEFLEHETRAWYEIPTHFFVHANAYPGIDLRDQPDYMLYWEFFGQPRPHRSKKIMVCGHSSQKSGVPKNIGHAVCIDTWVYGSGWLTCLDVATGKYWQANQKGETRSAYLDDN